MVWSAKSGVNNEKDGQQSAALEADEGEDATQTDKTLLQRALRANELFSVKICSFGTLHIAAITFKESCRAQNA